MTHPHEEPMEESRPELEEKLSELEILRQSLEQAKSKEKEVYDQLLRLTAEFQNFRKRSEARVMESRRAGREDVLLQVISLGDALSQAEIASRQASNVETLKKGIALVKEQFEKFLMDQGLVAIKTKGEKFDPQWHEAIARVVNAELEEGVIVDEIQRGYTMNGQVVRPSRVSVSAHPHKESPAKAKEEEHHV